MKKCVYINILLLFITITLLFSNKGFSQNQEKTTDLNNAITELQAVTKLEPDNLDARYNLGITYYDNGMIDDAINEFNTLTSLGLISNALFQLITASLIIPSL